MKCAICKLEIQEGQKIIQCSYCLAAFHEEHYNKWTKQKSTCPVCFKEIKSSLATTDLIDIKPINEITNTQQFSEFHFYKNLGLNGLSIETILHFVKSNDNFGFSINEKTPKSYILKKRNYFAYNLTYENSTTYLSLSVLHSFLSFFMAAFMVSITPGYIILPISIINFILSVFIFYRYVKSAKSLSKKWVALEFQEEQIRVISSKIGFGNYSQKSDEIIAIPKIVEFEIGNIKGLRDNMIVYLALKTIDNNEYFFGEIYKSHLEKAQKFSNNLTHFLKDNYGVIITNTNAKYQKKRRRVITTYLSLIVGNILVSFAIIIYFVIYFVT